MNTRTNLLEFLEGLVKDYEEEEHKIGRPSYEPDFKCALEEAIKYIKKPPKNELTWLETEYIRNDITMQPVLINNDKLLYTVFDNHGYNSVFDTILGLHKFLNGDTSGRVECFETEDEMIKYLEEEV